MKKNIKLNKKMGGRPKKGDNPRDGYKKKKGESNHEK